MIVGKTSTSITKAEIFSRFREIEVLSSIFPEIKTLPYKISSPFREDKNPSFYFFSPDSTHIYYKDFGTGEGGSLINFLCKYWNCTFRQVINRLADILIGKNHINIGKSPIKILTNKEIITKSKLQVVVRPWKDYDLFYWESYGIKKPWLKYAEIYPISYILIWKKTGEQEYKNIFVADKYAYCYVERKEGETQLKVYQPFNDRGFKWCSKMDSSVISLWTKVPEKGDKIIIASSVKDALCISNTLHIPAIAPQGEGYTLSDTAIKELKRRYEKVFIAYDGDSAGEADASKFSKTAGFPILHCPILEVPQDYNENVLRLLSEGLHPKNKAKDWSDIFLYFSKNRFIEEFNSALEKAEKI